MRYVILAGTMALATAMLVFAVFSAPIARWRVTRKLSPIHVSAYHATIEPGRIYAPSYPDSLQTLRKELKAKEATLGPDDAALAPLLERIARASDQSMVTRLEYRLGTAERCYRRALALWEKALPDEDPDLEASYKRLGDLYNAFFRPLSALPYFECVLEIRAARLGDEHPSLRPMLHTLAEIHRRAQNYQDAEALYLRSLGITEAARGPSHDDALEPLRALAAIYKQQERYEDAETAQWRILDIAPHPQSVQGLAHVIEQQGRSAEAEALLQDTLKSSETRGRRHVENAARLKEQLADVAARDGQIEKAEALYKEVIELGMTGKTGIPPVSAIQRLVKLYALDDRNEEIERLRGEMDAYMGPQDEQTFGEMFDLIFETGRRQAADARGNEAP